MSSQRYTSIDRKTVSIDSKYRTSGSTTQFQYDLGVTLNNILYIEIKDAIFTNILRNVNSNNNKINWIDSNGVTRFSIIPEGNYSVENLVGTIAGIFNGIEPNRYFGSYNPSTTKITVTTDFQNQNDRFSMLAGVSPNESVYQMLGFGVTNILDVEQYTTTQRVNLNPTKKIYICSTELMQNTEDTYITQITNLDKAIFDVDTNYDEGIYGNILKNETKLRTIEYQTPLSGITTIGLCLRDDQGRILSSNEINETVGIFNITIDIYSGFTNLEFY